MKLTHVSFYLSLFDISPLRYHDTPSSSSYGMNRGGGILPSSGLSSPARSCASGTSSFSRSVGGSQLARLYDDVTAAMERAWDKWETTIIRFQVRLLVKDYSLCTQLDDDICILKFSLLHRMLARLLRHGLMVLSWR